VRQQSCKLHPSVSLAADPNIAVTPANSQCIGRILWLAEYECGAKVRESSPNFTIHGLPKLSHCLAPQYALRRKQNVSVQRHMMVGHNFGDDPFNAMTRRKLIPNA
jgi:hypothetical protein